MVNYIRAPEHGINRLQTLPLSKRLLNEVHAVLLEDVRGQSQPPGELRITQNWIGEPGCTLETATFVPPPPDVMITALDDLERYLHSEVQSSHWFRSL